MSSPPPSSKNGKRTGLFDAFLRVVERLGNLLPHPVTLFALICVAVLLVSGIAGYFEWQVVDPRPEGAKGRSADGLITAVSLVNAEGLRRIGVGLVTNFTSFAPLGTVLVALLGVGVAERSGLLGPPAPDFASTRSASWLTVGNWNSSMIERSAPSDAWILERT